MFLENKSVINSLEGDLINKSYSHAYLFSGSKGIGKFSHAKNFARSILKETPEGISLCGAKKGHNKETRYRRDN